MSGTKPHILVCTAAAVTIAACDGSGDVTSVADEIRTIERGRVAALVAGDTASAGPVHATDFQLINPLGGAVSRSQYLGGLANGQLDYRVWEPDSMVVRVHDDVALVRYTSRLEIELQGQLIPLQRYWHTDAYEKRDGRWQVVWSHATLMQGDAADTGVPIASP